MTMKLRALALTSAAALAVIALSACPPKVCDQSNCQGCCKTNGDCVAPNDTSASNCGSFGNQCAQCLPGGACVSGQCIGGSTDGGNDGGQTGCAAQCVSGCCTSA